MLPTLFTLGPLAVQTKSIFEVIAFLASAFIFWRKTREEHYQEDQAFDAFLLASLVGVLAGRIGFILIRFAEFGGNIISWFDIVRQPGSSIFFAILGASLYLYSYAKKQKWDVFEILDFWFIAVAIGMVFRHLGNFFAGVGFGYQTNLPWGIVFPGVFEKHHPVQLYTAIFFILLTIYLQWAEYHYRTFTWYRAKKKTAQTGFLTSVFMIATGLFMLLVQLLTLAQVMVQGLRLDAVLYGVLMLSGVLLLLNKSGRWRS